MILADTGALYALASRADVNHAAAVACLRSLREPLAVHALILAETWYMLESRLGRFVARRLCDKVAAGDLPLLTVDVEDIAAALTIEQRYADLGLGLTDAVSFALCEREGITSAFTFDRKHFGAFRPSHAPALRLLP